MLDFCNFFVCGVPGIGCEHTRIHSVSTLSCSASPPLFIFVLQAALKQKLKERELDLSNKQNEV